MPLAPTRLPLTWLGAIVVGLCIFGIPSLIGQAHLTKRRFDETPIERLENVHLRYVFLGDSMLETRIDSRFFARLAGAPTVSLAYPGSGSAQWFLSLKNHVAVVKPSPRWIIIFYRGFQLTLPCYHTEGRHRPRLEASMHNAEPVLDRILADAGGTNKTVLDWISNSAYPIQKHRQEWEQKIQQIALDLTTDKHEFSAVRRAAGSVFDVRKLRSDAGPYAEGDEEDNASGLFAEPHDFTASVEASFLPEFLKLARQQGIRLLFYRVRRKPPADSNVLPETECAKVYQEALRVYLEAAGAVVIDESRDPAITRNFYKGDDHIREDMMANYTEIFWHKVEPLLSRQVAVGR